VSLTCTSVSQRGLPITAIIAHGNDQQACHSINLLILSTLHFCRNVYNVRKRTVIVRFQLADLFKKYSFEAGVFKLDS
jgi:hypothetical protein